MVLHQLWRRLCLCLSPSYMLNASSITPEFASKLSSKNLHLKIHACHDLLLYCLTCCSCVLIKKHLSQHSNLSLGVLLWYGSDIKGIKQIILSHHLQNIAPRISNSSIESLAPAMVSLSQQQSSPQMTRYHLRSKSSKLLWNPELNSGTTIIVTPEPH